MKNLLNKFKIAKKIKVNQPKKFSPAEATPKTTYEEWLNQEQEGQLVVDVYQTPTNIVIKSTVAGLKTQDLDISINNDMITIRGKRENEEEVKKEDYFYKECYWGGFSRSIILPAEVKADETMAELENGILTIIIPKINKANINIETRE